MTKIAVRRALISVYDKTGLDVLAPGLHAAGVEIVSTGSTAATIRALGIPVTPVDEVTGFPEILGGRVKTLHPHIHAGLLADQRRRARRDRRRARHRHVPAGGRRTSTRSGDGRLRGDPARDHRADRHRRPGDGAGVAKNHGSVAVVVDPARYGDVLAAVQSGGFDLAARPALSAAAFRHTASYDIAVAAGSAMSSRPTTSVDGQSSGFPGWIAASYERAAVLRYGENPHQRAALYVTHGTAARAGAGRAAGRQGDELQQLRRRRRGVPGRVRLRRAVRGDHQAREPVRHRRRRRHRRGAPLAHAATR